MAEEYNIHYVATRDEAYKISKGYPKYWVSNCGCREGIAEDRGTPCARSKLDVCLFWEVEDPGSGSGKKEISWSDAEELFRMAKEKHLVTRPFRSGKDKNITDGVCFCCDDCCGYFTEMDDEACDKGDLIESTNMDECIQCGNCVEVCYFKARKMDGGLLVVDRDKCFGCGLCLDVCPVDCIEMIKR
jgi:NAD-dependent dihydropyrimidine dehydrogenase PreA subunit